MFWKFFKRNEAKTPASHKPGATARPSQPKNEPASGNLGSAIKPAPTEKQPSYDPYNSGMFDKHGAWNKIKRK